ncbi:hypothetical protein AB0J74_05405 [Asanoa sp. NPDC049573]|uniref:hypothetical protein n=1 Tax=Asanoa sp. NPDC049573 TaxID=3155396 RepID=UPI0034284A60
MNRVEPPVTPDDERPVDLTGDEFLLPDQTADDTDRGWGEQSDSNDARLWEDVPPHWS